ncbi:glycosyltransferase family 4 protein [Mucilaginibacter xinganensis]|uniref:Glycosyl transferase family 1 domain-containing protein n=1 Tax=Mucilaginibacter xinganensis TaxID=1234841 RepID=A0A223NZY1_9SPHI|nr:glycosyltransferase family 1 protein [Mucilaginibacter xinganensis]ASU35128.1 hypothetical protein MuYL_3243 [Mucilaginibacter xinganensis]
MDRKGKKQIGILLVSNDIGVVYYLLSIVKAIGYLSEDKRPQIILLYADNCKKFLDLFQYEFLVYKEVDYNKNKKSKFLLSFFLRKNLFVESITKFHKLDGIFPLMDIPVRSNESECKVVSWIPDFQHKFYPRFFSRKNLFLRETRFKQIIDKSNALILSSEDAYSHLKKFYSVDNSKIKVNVMPFVSMIKDFGLTDFDILKKKYDITTPYFLVSNQFYAHKNHIIVLKAIVELKKLGMIFTVFFTGKTDDYRNPLFYSSLTDYIASNDIASHAKILGVIPREDQLGLLKNALAIIQPSKFEGWSTIIEDAKTLQKQIICSNIEVHLEQLGENAFYFNPDSVEELSEKIVMFLQNKSELKPVFDNYHERIEKFANEFLNAF